MFEFSLAIGRRPRLLRQAAVVGVLAAIAAGLPGCATRGPLSSGVDLYHDLQGGAIADQRPPPPGADAPYPDLATIPSRPPAPDIAAQQRIADRLAAQRDAADVAAAKSPLTPLPVVAPPPKPNPAAPPDPNGNRVIVDAAASPAAPPSRPAPAPPPAAQIGIDAVPALPASVVAGPLPTLAAAPPSPASGLGVLAPPIPPSVTTAAAAVPAADPVAPNTVRIAFTPGSTTLPPSANLNLRRFALAHKGGAFNVTGEGEGVLPSPDAQARALDLALRRAQSIAASLSEAGVPASNLHLHAQAKGQGGSASL